MSELVDLAAMDMHARRLLGMVGVTPKRRPSEDPVGERRKSFEMLMRYSLRPEADIEVCDNALVSGLARIPIRLYAPAGSPATLPGLIYFHGGGLVAGSLETHDGICRELAHGAGCRVAAIGYRLAPEYPFPAAIVDALYAVRAILRAPAAFGLRPGAIAVAGDSGGGTLATIVAQVMRRSGKLRAQVLLCPVLDFSEPLASRQTFAEGFLLDAATMAQDLAYYAPNRPLTDPRISPLWARDLSGLPPTIVHTAGFDPLRDEGAAYGKRLEACGVPVRHTCHDRLIHHFYGLTRVIPAARSALADIVRDVKACLS